MNNVMKGLKPSFTVNGNFVTFGTYDYKFNRTKICINKIVPNKDVNSKLTQHYENNTRVTYLECLQEKINQCPNIDQLYHRTQTLNIIDYTSIIDRYLENLEFTMKETNDVVLKSKLEAEIRILKLFKLLFLNNVTNRNYTKSLRVEVKLMRKAKLTEWLVQNSEDFFRSQLNKGHDPLVSLVSGRHENVLQLCTNPVEYPMNIMASLASITRSKEHLRNSIKIWKEESRLFQQFDKDIQKIYEIMSSSELDVYDGYILNFANWKTLLISLMVNTLKYRTYIPEVVQAYETIVNNSNHPLPLTTKRDKTDLGYLLIKYLAQIETNTPTADIVKLIEDTGSLSPQFVTHHVQYIIASILLNTLTEAYYFNIDDSLLDVRPEIDFEALKRLHFRLLVKNVEEFLLSDDWKHAIQLIDNSTIPMRLRNLMIKDIYSRYARVADSDPTYLQIESYTVHEAYAEFKLNSFDYEMAFGHFILAKQYSRAFDVLVFHMIYPEIILDNVGNKLHHELKALSEVGHSIPRWITHGKLILDYLFFKERFDVLIDEISFEDLEGILRSVERLTGELGYERRTYSVRNVMLKQLRKLYNRYAEIKSSNDVKNVLILDSLLRYS
jgi:hypothetical protein